MTKTKTLTALAAAATLGIAAIAAPQPAEARYWGGGWGGGAVAAGVIGGLAAGAIIGSAAGYGPYYGTNYWGGWGDTYTELRGVLTVDVLDAKNGALIWRGVENKHVHQTSKPASRDRRVTEEVADVFKHFPIRGGAVATSGVR